MGQPYSITAYPRPFPEGQASLMTRDLSHEEGRKSERGKLPVERDRRDGAGMKSKEGEKNEEGREKVSGGGEGYITGTIMGLMQTLVDNLGCLEVIVKVLDLIREGVRGGILNNLKLKLDVIESDTLHPDFLITQPPN